MLSSLEGPLYVAAAISIVLDMQERASLQKRVAEKATLRNLEVQLAEVCFCLLSVIYEHTVRTS